MRMLARVWGRGITAVRVCHRLLTGDVLTELTVASTGDVQTLSAAGGQNIAAADPEPCHLWNSGVLLVSEAFASTLVRPKDGNAMWVKVNESINPKLWSHGMYDGEKPPGRQVGEAFGLFPGVRRRSGGLSGRGLTVTMMPGPARLFFAYCDVARVRKVA